MNTQIIPLLKDLDLIKLVTLSSIDVINIDNVRPLKEKGLATLELTIRFTPDGTKTFLKTHPYMHSFVSFNEIKVSLGEITNRELIRQIIDLAQVQAIRISEIIPIIEQCHSSYFIGDETFLPLDEDHRFFMSKSTICYNQYDRRTHFPMDTFEDYLERYKMNDHRSVKFKIKNKIFDKIFSKAPENNIYKVSCLLNKVIEVELNDDSYTVYWNGLVHDSNVGDINSVIDSLAKIILKDNHLFELIIGDIL